MRRLLIFSLMALPAYPLACVSTASGDWSNASTWTSCGGGVPGNGDTATITNPHVVTVSDARTVGTGSGTAVSRAGSGAAFGRLVIANGGILTVRGNFVDNWNQGSIVANARALRIEGGGVFEFSAADGATFTINSPGVRPNAGVEFAGTVGNLAEIRSTAGANPGNIAWSGPADNSHITGSYFRVYRLGTATVAAIRSFTSGTTGSKLDIDHCIFDTTGGLATTSTAANSITSISDCIFINTVSAATISHSTTQPVGTGARLYRRLYLDKPLGNAGSTVNNFRDFTLEDIVNIGKPIYAPATGPAASVSDFFNIYPANAISDHGSLGLQYNRLSIISAGTSSNTHFLQLVSNYATTVSGFIAEGFTKKADASGEGDITLTGGSPSTLSTSVFEDVIVLPGIEKNNIGAGGTLFSGPAGTSITGATNTSPIQITTGSAHGRTTGDPVWIENVGGNTAANGMWAAITVIDPTNFTLDGSTGSANYTSGGTAYFKNYHLRVKYRNWTFYAGHDDGQGRALMQVGENFRWWPGYITQNQGNIVWSYFSNVGLNSSKMFATQHSASGYLPDTLTSAETSYNSCWNCASTVSGNLGATNQGEGFSLRFSSAGVRPTTGNMFNSENPKFVDPKRNYASAANYMAARLGLAEPSAWATGTAYSVGDFITRTDPNYWHGQTIRFRCIQAHTSATTSTPMSGSSWLSFWEPATRQYLQDQYELIARGSGGLINGRTWNREIYEWIRAGFAPLNLKYANPNVPAKGIYGATRPILTGVIQ